MQNCWSRLPVGIIENHVLPCCDIDIRLAFKIQPRTLCIDNGLRRALDAHLSHRAWNRDNNQLVYGHLFYHVPLRNAHRTQKGVGSGVSGASGAFGAYLSVLVDYRGYRVERKLNDPTYTRRIYNDVIRYETKRVD
jgi:hypothetical protein